MDLDKLFKLIDAGFNHDEIVAMFKPAEAPQSAPAEETAPVEEPAPAEEKPAEAPQDAAMAALLAEIKGLRSDMQKNNINSDTLKMSNVDSATAILGNIINPPVKEKK